ncbi:MAG: M20/M25/M40 family metallo-hydrolase [Candidatus Eisenbacteria bacterium]|nr:M20/M25/M40 family metallo-hydrolase [Candidatus Eisenbacteria bacterium]
MTSPAGVIDAVNERRLTGLLVEAVSQYSPSGREGPAVEVFGDGLHAAGIPHERHPVPGVAQEEERFNLVAHVGPEPLGLSLIGHTDTIDLWGDEHLEVRRDGDRLYGLGAADMKSGCAAIIEAAAAVVSTGIKLKRGFQIGLVVGEEEYGDGIAALIESDLVSAPLTVVGEPTGLAPCTDHFSYAEYSLSGGGRRRHAALAQQGANAIHTTLDWISAILSSVDREPIRGGASLSLREIRGGTHLFIVPDKCEVVFDVHLPPGLPVGLLDELIEEARRRVLENHPGSRLAAERLFWAPGYVTAADDPRLAPLQRAFSRAELAWNTAAFPSHSDASLLHKAGTLPVVCGPGALEVAHTSEEHVSLEETLQAAQLYASMICEACVE